MKGRSWAYLSRHGIALLGLLGVVLLSGAPAYAGEAGVLRYSGAQQGMAHFASANCSFIDNKLQMLMAPHRSGHVPGDRDSGPFVTFAGGGVLFQLDQKHVTADSQFMRVDGGQGVSAAHVNGHWIVTFHDVKLVNLDLANQKTLVLNGSLRCADVVSMKQPTYAGHGQGAGKPQPVSKVHFDVLPDSAWATLANAKGIVIDDARHAQPSIQVVFDPNNPYDAWVYRRLRRDYPNIPVRWVPVAYMSADSAAMAGAMLASSDPAASLAQDLGQYDKQAKHGGYPLPAGHRWGLPAANQTLFEAWKNWGGYTPMFVLRGRDGRVLKTGGARADVLRSVVAHARKPEASSAVAVSPVSDRLEFKAAQMCQSTPSGIRRAGCIHSFRQELADMHGKVRLSDEQMATAMTTVALQSVLALDATVRYWHTMTQWAWPMAAHRAPFQALSEGLGGYSRQPPQSMPCPGGGTLGLINNGGGARELATHHRIPIVDVGFSKHCRVAAGGPSATAVTPSVRYGTQFSAPDGHGQTSPEPVYLLFNSQPRLDSMPAWIPQGPLGEVRARGGHIRVYADTPKENDRGLGFTFWPQQAHSLEHRPYVGVTLRVDAQTPGVKPSDCIENGRRCLLLDTAASGPGHIVAHYRLLGSLTAAPQPVPPDLAAFAMMLDTTRPLTFSGKGPGMTWQHGELTLRGRPLPPQANPRIGGWIIRVSPERRGDQSLVRIAWQHGSGKQARSGVIEVAQTDVVTMPHYCAKGEAGWACVARDYYPDWDEN